MVPGPNAKPHTLQDLHVTEIRQITCCSYVSLIVDTRNITGRHSTGNASTYEQACIRSIDQNLLAASEHHRGQGRTLGVMSPGNGVMWFALLTSDEPDHTFPPRVLGVESGIWTHSW